ncbi:outer membrane beta-barrel protein [Marixanthomonas sp. SCSIO 43207]|uniref:CsgG/HfaB family protein n=1 Tax=Marixanthomonas sp. SCSIO 43207 TaxID=2779360 RepID=UPI001CA9D0BE|nr:CsgG/HfaB family protein [Marixanthomonas sp. SCSIO 43207]UAB81304.1 outer membrane beta-barrel protein [Marixanthomonas sp. SCSIO 43207]
MINFTKLILIAFAFILTGCGGYFNQPVGPQKARIGEISNQTKRLASLPEPAEPIIVGVYNFKDQTGQYKSIEAGSTFSTAITQGATTILIKALEDSKWFRPIERENLSNLLNERNIIETTRQQYSDPNKEAPKRLNPLLFAGILLEGGVVSYDTNLLTGGAGARYFGVGGSTQYRQDRITVYLRAISTSSGEILKTVYVSKTILSQAVDVGLFRYVNFKRLLEAETGFTKNEPTQIAVQSAVEKAVEMLIIEGVQEKLWSTKEGAEKNKELVENYLSEKEIEESTGLYERAYKERNNEHSINLALGTAYIDGDYSTAEPDFKVEAGYTYNFTPMFGAGYDIQLFRLYSTPQNRYWWLSQNLDFKLRVLPHDRLSPVIYGGPGFMNFVDDSPSKFLQVLDGFFKVKAGLGMQYQLSDRLSLELNGDFNKVFSDKIDNEFQGTRDDYYYNFGFGLSYNFGFGKKNNEPTDNK